uniref:hypothetical protein n=1 Tax=Kibdelosporangium persicum TaxID=2698649 RepID=UPI001C26A8BF
MLHKTPVDTVPAEKVRTLGWGTDIFSLDDVQAPTESPVRITGIPNARLASEAGQPTVSAVDPHDVAAWADRLGVIAYPTWSPSADQFDVIVLPSQLAGKPVAGLRISAEESEQDDLVNVPFAALASEELMASVRSHVAGRLPDYMVPSALVAIPEIPLNPNGKLDRRGLPVPVVSRVVGGGGVSPVEVVLCGLFGEVLGVGGVGVDDDFFGLGG